MISPARRAAFLCLRAIGREGRDSASAIDSARRQLADGRDTGLLAELVLGVLRWQAALDAALAPLVDRPLDGLDDEVLFGLRLGAYQRLFLTRVPASAAVNDAVSLVREAGRNSAAGLVNAVLRRLDPDRARTVWPSRPIGPATRDRARILDYLSVTLSHPRWLVARWLDRHGFEAVERWARFDNTPAPVVLRPLAWRTTADGLAQCLAAHGVSTRPSLFAREALVVSSGNPFQSPCAAEGLFVAQDEASQLVAQLVIDLAPSRVLDACAAPGGKTLAIRGGLGAGGHIVACDLRPRRVRLLASSLARAGAATVPVVQADVSRGAPFLPAFDLVLVDAPCSGLGTIRREPEIRWRRQLADLGPLSDRQVRLLAQAATCVLPGGRLVYATCSSEPEENEQVVDRFLGEARDFARLDRSQHPWARSGRDEVLDPAGDLRTHPHRHGLESFYAAVLVRRPTPERLARGSAPTQP